MKISITYIKKKNDFQDLISTIIVSIFLVLKKYIYSEETYSLFFSFLLVLWTHFLLGNYLYPRFLDLNQTGQFDPGNPKPDRISVI